jgi:hypothetical protein
MCQVNSYKANYRQHNVGTIIIIIILIRIIILVKVKHCSNNNDNNNNNKPSEAPSNLTVLRPILIIIN